ncbi:MAG: hypothetical protein V1907_02495 [Candidatus Kerfeldbacteria bacterium]
MNIEYTHIYLDEKIDSEKLESMRVAKGVIDTLNLKKIDYTACVLIDDYNPVEKTLSVENFLQTLNQNGVEPDFVVFESSLVQYSDMVIDMMSRRLQKEYKRYINTRKFVPCSLLIAIWHLARLGKITINPSDIRKNSNRGVPFIREKLITILPGRYRQVEERARRVLESIGKNNILNNADSIYF